jgi:outer membrane protein assembly factor BamA
VKRAWIVLAACGGTPRHVEPPPAEPPKPPPTVEWSELTGSIRAVEVAGADATAAKDIEATLAGEIGHNIDRRRLRAALDKISDAHHAGDVIARGVQLADGVKLVVELVPNPIVHQLVAHEAGKDVATPAELVAAVGLPLDPIALDHVADRLRERYQERGFIEADVKWTKQKAGDKVDVAIEITPGRQVTITGIELRGNAKVKKDDLIKQIAGDFAPKTPWQQERIEHAALAITDEYYNRGYINAVVKAEPPTGESTPAAFTIVEGDQYKIGSIVVTGVPAADKKKYAAALTVKKGDVFNRKAVMAAMQKVEDAAKAAGLANAGVTPIVSTDAKKKTVEIVLEISH